MFEIKRANVKKQPKFTFRTFFGRYISARSSGAVETSANVDSWEEFHIVPTNDGKIFIQSPTFGKYLQVKKSAFNKSVVVQVEGSHHEGTTFRIFRSPEAKGFDNQTGYAILSCDNEKWLSAKGDGGLKFNKELTKYEVFVLEKII